MGRMAVTTFGIRSLADEFGVTTRTIRFYEDEGLLSPRRDGTRRLFSQRDRVRLKLVLRGRRLGFSLSEIKEIIGMYDAPAGEVGQLRLMLEKIGERRRDLEDKRRDIDEALSEMADIEASCRSRLAELTDAATQRKRAT